MEKQLVELAPQEKIDSNWLMEFSRLAQENRELKEELAWLSASIAEQREVLDLISKAFCLLAEARKND